MSRKMVKPEKQLNPYSGGLDDKRFLESLGIPYEEARQWAASIGAPFTADEIPEVE